MQWKWSGFCVNSAKVYTFVCVCRSTTSPVGDCLTPPAQEVTGEAARCLCGNVVNRNLQQVTSDKIWTGFKKIPYSTLVFLDWYLNVDILIYNQYLWEAGRFSGRFSHFYRTRSISPWISLALMVSVFVSIINNSAGRILVLWHCRLH